MFFVDNKTNKHIHLTKDEQEYLQSLVSRLDLVRTYKYAFIDGLDNEDCELLSNLLQTHIDSNKIFEHGSKDKPVPVIIDDNNKKPAGYRPLSLESLEFLSTLSTFLERCSRGYEVTS